MLTPTLSKLMVAGLVMVACTGLSSAQDAYEITENATADCSEVDDWIDQPSRDFTVVLDVVAMPAAPKYPTALQTSNSDGGLWEGVKWGISVRNGAPTFTVSVPDDYRDRVFISEWGTEADVWEVHFPGCHRTENWVRDWLIWGGGLTVREAECIPLAVTRGDLTETVVIGVGAPCPGQAPPPEPSS